MGLITCSSPAQLLPSVLSFHISRPIFNPTIDQVDERSHGHTSEAPTRGAATGKRRNTQDSDPIAD